MLLNLAASGAFTGDCLGSERSDVSDTPNDSSGRLSTLAAPGGHALAGVNRWTTAGPYGGNVLSLAVDPSTSATLYAGTRNSGIFKSVNGGQS